MIKCSCGWQGRTWQESNEHMLWAPRNVAHSIVDSARTLDESIDAALIRHEAKCDR